MALKLDKTSKERLVNARNFRDFIKLVLIIRSTDQKRFSYADLARKAGFSSRSFPREVVMGKKTLTLESLKKMSAGLDLSRDLIQYFTYLVELEIESCRGPGKTISSVEKSLMNLKSRIVQKESDLLNKKDSPFSSLFLPKVFAALGSEINGASTAEVKRRTSLSEETILTSLKSLEDIGLVIRKGIRFYPQVTHPSIQNLNSETLFKSYFKENLNHISNELDADYGKSHSLFFNSCFLISVKEVTRLKEELRELLLKYVDENESPNGDKVLSLTCALR